MLIQQGVVATSFSLSLSPSFSLSSSLPPPPQAQYLFVYDALLHAYIHGCTEVTASLLGTHLASLDKPVSDGSEETVLDQEFKHVISMRFPSDHFFSVAMEDCNAAKNRSIENLPCKFVKGKRERGGRGMVNVHRITCTLKRSESLKMSLVVARL